MTAIPFENRSDDGLATLAILGAMGVSAAALIAWQSTFSPDIAGMDLALRSHDCAACHVGDAVLQPVTLTHADVGLDLSLIAGSQAVHTAQYCASCHTSH